MVLLPAIASAAIYWVSPTGASSWASCQGSSPLNGASACSIATANSNAAAGDVVNIKGGTYTSDTFISPQNSGTRDKPVTFTAYNDEVVVINNQLVPNYNHDSSPWAAMNGASVQHSLSQAYSGPYSTRFTASAGGQGIRSDAFSINTHSTFSLWVYSDQPKVNVYIQKGDNSGPVVNQDYDILPNQWNRIGRFFPSSSDPGYGQNFRGSNAYIAVRAPEGMQGTWYVDDVRIHSHGYAAIYLNGNDYIRVKGIIVNNTQRGLVIQRGSDYNEVSHCMFTNMANGYYTPNLIMDGWNPGDLPSTHNWIHHNIFFKNGYVVTSAPEDCDDIVNPFRIGSGKSATDYSRYNLVENNTFYSGGHDHIIISSSNNIIRNNIFHNEGWMENKIGKCQDSDGNPNTFNQLAKFGNRNVLFENPSGDVAANLLEGNRIGFAGTPPDDDGANGIEMPTDKNIIRHNYIFGNGASGIYFKQQGGNPDHNRIYHNSIYRNGRGEDIDSGYQSGIKYNCYLTNPVGNVIKNNILFDNAMANIRAGTCSSDVVYNINSYTDNFEENPLFKNPDMSNPSSTTLPDLSLQQQSPAIDKATHLTQANGVGTSSITLVVDDASYFQDGSWGSDIARGISLFADWIAVGNVDNVAEIRLIDYSTNTLTLASPLSWPEGAPVWLYRKSDGQRVLYGSAPDYGAYEYAETPSQSIPGDLNGDGLVNSNDFFIVVSDFGKASGFNNLNSDANKDGIIDIYDIVYVASRMV